MRQSARGARARERWLRVLTLALGIGLGLGGSRGAEAVSFPLGVEFDAGLLGSFGTVSVTASGGDLQFQISLAPALGSGADLHEFYFNLGDGFTGLMISSTDSVNSPYTFSSSPSVAGGAGSSFDFGVNFGNGAGNPGNGVLQMATFSLSANQALSIADLLISSSTSQNLQVFFAAHIQGTSLVQGATSETVGTLVPEPATLALALLGLIGLAIASPRRRPEPTRSPRRVPVR